MSITVELEDGRLSYTVRGLAKATDTGETAIREAIKSGDLVARENGPRKTLILREDALAWLRSLPVKDAA